MYKKFDFDALCKIDNNLIKNLRNLYKKKGFQFFKDFLKKVFDEGSEVYFFESNAVSFRIVRENSEKIIIFDENEKIELMLEGEEIQKMHNLLKDDKKIKNMKQNNKSIMDDLIEDFRNGDLNIIEDSPFLVYDIETIGDINSFSTLKFKVGYSLLSNDNHSSSMAYKYVSEDNLKKFVDFLLNFNGYIIGYNHIYFDNPVVCYNAGYQDKEVELLNSKSLDLFLFLWNLTGRRMGLDKVSQSLVSVGKTLSSGKEGEEAIMEYEKTGDEKLLQKVKKYCRNDVKMTLGVLLYILKYKKIYMEGKEIEYTIRDFVQYSKQKINKDQKETLDSNQLSIF